MLTTPYKICQHADSYFLIPLYGTNTSDDAKKKVQMNFIKQMFKKNHLIFPLVDLVKRLVNKSIVE